MASSIRAEKVLRNTRIAGDSDAAGLIICKDDAHAEAVQDLLPAGTAERVGYRISDSAKRLQAFKNSTARWLVSVDMVSEGVDIPRLIVAIFATNKVNSELYFRQAAGRISRWNPSHSDRQMGHFFIPPHPKLLKWAEEIKHERDAVVTEHPDFQPHEPGEVPTIDGEPRLPQSIIYLRDIAHRQGGGYFDGTRLEDMQRILAQRIIGQMENRGVLGLTEAQVLTILELGQDILGGAGLPEEEAAGPAPAPEPKAVEYERTRAVVAKLAPRIAFKEEIPFSHVWKRLFNAVGIVNIDQASLPQLERLVQIAQRWRNEGVAP